MKLSTLLPLHACALGSRAVLTAAGNFLTSHAEDHNNITSGWTCRNHTILHVVCAPSCMWCEAKQKDWRWGHPARRPLPQEPPVSQGQWQNRSGAEANRPGNLEFEAQGCFGRPGPMEIQSRWSARGNGRREAEQKQSDLETWVWGSVLFVASSPIRNPQLQGSQRQSQNRSGTEANRPGSLS